MQPIHSCVERYGSRLGRIFIGILFLVSGIGILMGFRGFVSYIPQIFGSLSLIVAILVVAIKIGGGVGLVFGIRVREASYALILFVALTIVFVHYNLSDQNQMIQALKNLAIIGGLLMVAKNASGSNRSGTKTKVPNTDTKKQDATPERPLKTSPFETKSIPEDDAASEKNSGEQVQFDKLLQDAHATTLISAPTQKTSRKKERVTQNI